MRRLVRHENEAPVADEAHGREGGAEQRSGIGHDDTGRVLFPNNQPGNDDLYSLYGTWPVGLALIACTTLAGIGVHRAGIYAASLGFSV